MSDGLTTDEQACADLAADFANAFRALPQTHPSDMGDVVFHVHALQSIICMRIAQRVDPKHWPVRSRGVPSYEPPPPDPELMHYVEKRPKR